MTETRKRTFGGHTLEGMVGAAYHLLGSLLFVMTLAQLGNAASLTYYPLVSRLTAETELAITILDPMSDVYVTFALGVATVALALLREGLKGAKASRKPLLSLLPLVLCLLAMGSSATAFAAFSLVLSASVLAVEALEGRGWRFLEVLLAVTIAVEGVAAAHWMSLSIDTGMASPVVVRSLVELEEKVFYLLSWFSPYLFSLCVFVWLLGPACRFVRALTEVRLDRRGFRASVALDAIRPKNVEDSQRKGVRWLLVLAAMAVSVLVAAYPNLPLVNPSGASVGVDFPQYEGELRMLLSLRPEVALVRAFTFSFGGSRPAFTLVLYVIAALSGSPASEVVRWFPAVLGPLLVVATIVLMREGKGTQSVAELAGLMTAMSPAVVGMTYGGLLANWFSLSVGYLAVGLLCASIDKGKWDWGKLVASGIILGLCDLAHPWTWSWIVASLVVFVASRYLLWRLSGTGPEWRSDAKAVLVVVGISCSMDLVKSLAFGSGTGFAFGYSAASQWSGIVNLFLMGGNLSYALKILLGGVLSNYLFLVFAAIGGFQLVHRTDKVGRFCLSSLILASIWLPISNAWALHRIALVVPFSALAATGVGAVASGLEKRASRRVASLFIALVLLSSISFAFRSTVNLVPVGPL